MCQLEIGNAYIAKTPPNGTHLYIIIAEFTSESFLLLNITTSKTQIELEKDCIIEPGEGVPSFVTRQSTIAYQWARDERINDIKNKIKKGEFIYGGRFSEEYIREIQKKGACSKNLAKKYRKVLEEILVRYELESYG